MQKGSKKIVLTGGHAATTAIATVEEIKKRKKSWDICWIGSKKAIEGKKIIPLETEVFPNMGVRITSLTTGRIQRKFTLWTLPSILKIPLGFVQALFLLTKIKPKIILSFGGYAAYPVVVAGWLLKIPIIIHEQTSAIGRANKFSIPFAKKILLARSQSRKYFPREKTAVIGNPVMRSITLVRPKDKIGKPPIIFITGGSRGSQFINHLIAEILEVLLQDFKIIHHSGYLDFEKFKSLKSKLPDNKRGNYEVYQVIDPLMMHKIYRRIDIIVARAGANSVSEILIIKRPTIFIPLEFSYKKEQLLNAKFAQDFGIAEILPQKGLTAEVLRSAIYKLRQNWEKIVSRVAGKVSPDLNAADKVVDILEQSLS